MKKRNANKKIWYGMLIMLLCFAGCLSYGFKAEAASVKVQKKARAYVGFQHETYVTVTFPGKGYSVKNLKSGSKSLAVRKSGLISYDDSESIELYAKKKGTYRFSFDVYKADKKVSRHTVKVYAVSYTGGWNVDGKYILKNELKHSIWRNIMSEPFYYTTKTSVKIGYSVPKGCKLIRIEKNDKKIKNGKKTALPRSDGGGSTVTTKFRAVYKDTYTNSVIETSLYIVSPAR